MRVVATHSAPRQCPDCGSEKIGETLNIIENGENSLLCHDCGIWMQLAEGEQPDLTASLYLCPHCRTVGAFEEMGGEEWCNGCGLDPNVENYSASTLSHLWKKESGIQGLLQRETSLVDPDRNLGKFLRTYCGPHCSFAGSCPQEIGNLITCYREEYPNKPIGVDMGRKSKKARKQRKLERRLEQEAISRASKKALVQCASEGWFEKVLYANSPCPEQARDTETGSGT